MAEKEYIINECFYSLQGEGLRAGTANVFVRMAGCNLACDIEPGPRSPGGFRCDTEFTSGRRVTLEALARWCAEAVFISLGKPLKDLMSLAPCPEWPEPWIVLTGGEPLLQADTEFFAFWKERGVKVAIETNGTLPVPVMPHPLKNQWPSDDLKPEDALPRFCPDWITLSPKTADHTLKQRFAHEYKVVRAHGQAVPRAAVAALHYLISPAFDAGQLHPATLAWCQKLVLEDPRWRLSVQQHHGWGAR